MTLLEYSLVIHSIITLRASLVISLEMSSVIAEHMNFQRDELEISRGMVEYIHKRIAERLPKDYTEGIVK